MPYLCPSTYIVHFEDFTRPGALSTHQSYAYHLRSTAVADMNHNVWNLCFANPDFHLECETADVNEIARSISSYTIYRLGTSDVMYRFWIQEVDEVGGMSDQGAGGGSITG